MRHDVVFREITGRGYRSPNVPAQMMERSASFCEIRNKEEQTGKRWNAASNGAIRVMRKQESAEAIVAQRRE